jgi:hypothetical protein
MLPAGLEEQTLHVLKRTDEMLSGVTGLTPSLRGLEATLNAWIAV